MSDLISRDKLIVDIENQCFDWMHYTTCMYFINAQPSVEPARGEWVYWRKQCEYCMNRNPCPYPENQESMEALKQWEKENKFWGSLKLICDYYVLDKDKYYLDNPPECNVEG